MKSYVKLLLHLTIKTTTDEILSNGFSSIRRWVPAECCKSNSQTNSVKNLVTTLSYDKEAALENWEKQKTELGVDSVELELLETMNEIK